MGVFVIKRGFSILQSRNSILRYILNSNAAMCSPIDIIQERSQKCIHHFPKAETTQMPTRVQWLSTVSNSYATEYDAAADENRPQLHTTAGWISQCDVERGRQKPKNNPLCDSTYIIFTDKRDESGLCKVRRELTLRCAVQLEWRGPLVFCFLIIWMWVTWGYPVNEHSLSCACDLYVFLYCYFNKRFFKTEAVIPIRYMTTALCKGSSQPGASLFSPWPSPQLQIPHPTLSAYKNHFLFFQTQLCCTTSKELSPIL